MPHLAQHTFYVLVPNRSGPPCIPRQMTKYEQDIIRLHNEKLLWLVRVARTLQGSLWRIPTLDLNRSGSLSCATLVLTCLSVVLISFVSYLA